MQTHVQSAPAASTQVSGDTLSPQKLLSLGVLSPAEVDRILDGQARTRFLIDDFLPSKSIAIVAGDSGIGKTPLICQLCLSVAAGLPFLGMQTAQAAFFTWTSKTCSEITGKCATRFCGFRAAAGRQRIFS